MLVEIVKINFSISLENLSDMNIIMHNFINNFIIIIKIFVTICINVPLIKQLKIVTSNFKLIIILYYSLIYKINILN